jgi:hypothetical protein
MKTFLQIMVFPSKMLNLVIKHLGILVRQFGVRFVMFNDVHCENVKIIVVVMNVTY